MGGICGACLYFGRKAGHLSDLSGRRKCQSVVFKFAIKNDRNDRKVAPAFAGAFFWMQIRFNDISMRILRQIIL